MPFKTNLGHELFNDCLYFRKIARELLKENKRENIFEIRRALRNSSVSLSMFWEHWLGSTLYSFVTKRVWEIIDPTKPSIDSNEIKKSVQLDRLMKQGFDLKLDLLVLLSGIDLKRDKTLKENLEKMREERNSILHQGSYDWTVGDEGFLERIDKAIETTRRFFSEVWEAKIGTKLRLMKYLYNEDPIDLKTLGYGYLDMPQKAPRPT